jgi:hypothetical protein
MPQFLTNVNLSKNEIQNARIHNLASAPSSPVEGQLYQNTTDHYLYCNSFKNNTPWYGEHVTVLRQVKNKSWVEPIEELKFFLQKESSFLKLE